MRLPDFLVIGSAKSGTTTLFEWFAAQPDFAMPDRKEPHFFARDELWERGLGHYAKLFEHAPLHARSGEASTTYTSPDLATASATRIHDSLPDVRLIYLVRHPVERLRSAYRHGRQLAAISGTLDQAMHPDSHRLQLVGRSRYHACLEPYIRRFPREQLLVVRFEDLYGGDHVGWSAILAHVGVDDRPPPPTAHNVSAGKRIYPAPAMKLARSRVPLSRFVPGRVKRAATSVLDRIGPDFEDHLEDSKAPLPPAVIEELREDTARLEAWLGVEQLWPDDTWDR